MRTLTVALGAAIAIAAGSAIAAEVAIEKMPYPGVVALSQDRPNIWIYKSFPTFLPLYIFDGEPNGKSTCDEVCSAVWPIIKAEDNSKAMGVWTIVNRPDGRKQWAFKGHPVYTYFEDSPNDPRGIGKEQEWFLDEAGVAYLIKAGVKLPPDFKPDPSKKKTANTTATALQP